MTGAVSKWLKSNNISNRLSPDINRRVRIITLISTFPLLIHGLLAFFTAWLHNYSVAFFCAVNTTGSILVIILAKYKKVLSAKTLLMCINTFAVFVYINQFELSYNIFCYFFPLIFGLIVLFDFKSELPSFYLVVAFTLICGLITLLLPAHFFGKVEVAPGIKDFFAVFNIITAILIVIVFLFLLIKITVDTELQLQKALEVVEETAAAKAAFLRNMSHELRTPLNGITGTTDIMLHDSFLPDQRANLHTLKNLSEHMTALVNDILDFSKIEAGRLELHSHRFNLQALFNKISTTFLNHFTDKKITFQVEVDPALAAANLYSDELRLQQVLYNLISNAAKFTHKGNVTLSAKLLKQEEANVTVRIAVIDTGIGIEPEKLKDIFKSFRQGDAATTRKYGGTGLGLSISSSLVKLFGSNLDVKSIPGEGSEFYMTLNLPLYETHAVTNDETSILPDNLLQNKHVLVAEDNAINRVVAGKALERLKIPFVMTENGRVAVEEFGKQAFDIVLLDLEMPEMDGRSALAAIKKINPAVPVVAFTAAFYENLQSELTQLGFAGYILKPFKQEDLYRTMVNTLRKSVPL